MTNFSNKDVSVLIAAYNAEKTIKRAIESVLLPGNVPKEILIYDDASLDGTVAVINKFFGQNSIIKVYHNRENKGAGIARRSLIEKSRGRLIAFIDADDEWFENKLEKQISLLNAENSHICVCSYETLNERGKLIGIRHPPRKITHRNLHLSNWIPTSMVVFRRDLKNTSSMPSMRTRQDYAYWLMLLKSNPNITVSNYPEVLGKYYRQNNSLSSKKFENIRQNYFVFRHYLKYGLSKSILILFLNIITRILRA